MRKNQSLHAFDQIKQLADSRCMQILRLLMAKPATLSHLARILGQSPACVHLVTISLRWRLQA